MNGRNGTAPGSVLGPTVAGKWYPADRAGLERQLDGFFADADSSDDRVQAKPAVLIVPHAGFEYSGLVAAKGFRRIGSCGYERVILLGPNHYVPLEGAAVPSSSTYRTPLGDVPLDVEAIESLGGAAGLRVDDGPFQPEHCLEAEIPFLQRQLRPGWRLLPLLVGMLDPRTGGAPIADLLRPFRQPDTLIVVSSDFTHYGRSFDYVPFDRDVPARIEALDMEAVERILAWDGAGFETYLTRTGATICGRNAIRVLLHLVDRELDGDLAAYDTSGRMTGQWDHSVSYASLAFREPDEGDTPS